MCRGVTRHVMSKLLMYVRLYMHMCPYMREHPHKNKCITICVCIYGLHRWLDGGDPHYICICIKLEPFCTYVYICYISTYDMHVVHAWNKILHQIWWDGDVGMWLYIVMAPYHMSSQHDEMPRHEWMSRILDKHMITIPITRLCHRCNGYFFVGGEDGCTNPNCEGALVVVSYKNKCKH